MGFLSRNAFLNMTIKTKEIVRKYFFSFVFFVIVLNVCSLSHSQDEKFFSYKRFLLNQNFISSIPGKNELEKDVKKFSELYTDAFYAFSENDFKKAEKKLKMARNIWPEYYGTDFLLAVLYEESGNYNMAARYYRSYLNKLKALHDGVYVISAPIIKGLNMFGIENYEPSEQLVRRRLSLYDIELEDVRPAVTVPLFLMPLVVISISGLIFLVTKKKIIPHLKMRDRIKNPPEGFWVCPYCGTDNPLLRMECEECRRERGEQ